MIKPVNNHLLIEPITQEFFIATDNTTYQEIGVVIAISDDLYSSVITNSSGGVTVGDFSPVKVGDKVYFDSWLAAKFPKNRDEFYWLIQWGDVRAIEHAEPETVQEINLSK